MSGKVIFGERIVGDGAPVFVIAEAGVNHNGDVGLALQLVDAAVAAGADAVKYQTFRADALVTPEAPKARYQLQDAHGPESQLVMLRRLELSLEAHREIHAYCHERKIIFLSTPFDEESVDLLDELGVPAFKISSGDITNLPLLRHVASKMKPILLSTGMSCLDEVAEAVRVVQEAGGDQIVLLHCVSNYPTDPADVNLRAIQTMKAELNLPVGFSDHTEGIEIALAAVASGACVIEKHFTLDRSLPGPDHRASLEPDDLKALVGGIRKVEAALGHGRKIPADSETEVALVARRSLTAASDIPAGARITRELITMKRPGTGIKPAQINSLIGRVARVDIASGSLLKIEMFE